MNDRKQILEQLLQMDGALSYVIESLKRFSWDSEPVAILTKQHIIHVLELFLGGTLSTTQVEDWANVIEGREDIGYEAIAHKQLIDVIHQLANPLLTRQLNEGSAKQLFIELR